MNRHIRSRLDQLVDERANEAVAMVQALVRVPSDNPPGDCAPHAAVACEQLEALGFDVEVHRVPADLVRANGMASATNLIVRHRFGPGPTIALNAHGDVVPAGGGWTRDPYGGDIEDGWLYGRGAAVSKSDFATYAFALRALIDSDVELEGTVELHFTWDEEIGGHVGPAWLLSEGLSHPDYAVCAAFSYDVVTAHNGCLHLEVTVHGKSAHAAWSSTGNDALEATTHILQDLYQYRDGLSDVHSSLPGLSHPTMVVGLIEGGINTNVVPDRVTFRLDRRILPEENPDEVEHDLRALLAASAEASPGINLSVERILLAKQFGPVGDAARLASVFCRRAGEILEQPVGTTALPLYTDARHYAEAGVATVMYGAGPKNPLDANGHRADERVPVETIHAATRVVAAALADLLAPQGGGT